MIRRQTSRDSKVFGDVSRRSKAALRSKPESSPLLINTVHQHDEVKEACISQEQDIIEIKELCQSPRASHCSMFNFSPTPSPSPDNSPTLSHKDLSDDSSISQESMHTPSNPTDSPPLSERRRYMVINELISTEEKYIDNLNLILMTFLPALEHVVSPRSLRLLIPAQLEQLVENHEEILINLKHRISSDSEFYGIVGDIFSKLCRYSNMEFFNMYRVYMGEFMIAMKTLATYEKDSAQFKEILSLLQQGPLCERLNLASYLLTPVQRLPRYEILLKELLKHTPVEHPDHYFVEEALGRLHKELAKLDRSIKSCQMVCSANGKTPLRMRGTNSANSVGRRTTKRARRTLSMLKRFVSTTNIDDYSSGDSSLAEELTKAPRMRRRNAVTVSSTSMCGSDVDLTASLGSDNSHTLRESTNRAVSCSDLLFEFNNKKQLDFQLLTPLASEACTPASICSSRHNYTTTTTMEEEEEEEEEKGRHGLSLFYSSNSSLSSLDSHGRADLRDESLTPTEVSSRRFVGPMFSTPASHTHYNKDATLKHSATVSEGMPLDITTDDITDSSKKPSWKTTALGKLKLKRRNFSFGKVSDLNSSEIKYLKDRVV